MINNIRTCNVEPTICPVPQTFNIEYKGTTALYNYDTFTSIQNPNDEIPTIIKTSEYFSSGANTSPSKIEIKVGNDITDNGIRGNSRLKITTTRKYTRNGLMVNLSPRINTKTINVTETENDYIKEINYGDSIQETDVIYTTDDSALNINHVQYGTYPEYLNLQFELKVNGVIQPNTGFTKTYNLEHRIISNIKEFSWVYSLWDSDSLSYTYFDGITVSDSSDDSSGDILTIIDPTITELKFFAHLGVYSAQGPGVSITSTTDELIFTAENDSSSNPDSPQIIGLGSPYRSYDDGKSSIYGRKTIVSGFNGLTGNHEIKLAITNGPERTLKLIMPSAPITTSDLS
jgi:hypothetical protein